MRPRHPVHLDSFDYLGQYRYSLRFCTDARRPVFAITEVVSLAWSQILRAAHEQAFQVPAYCFMPDHVHLLVEGTAPNSDLRRFVARAKQYSGYLVSRECGTRLWQRYGYERVLRVDEGSVRVARYIVENPVRAGLVERAELYPHTGSSVCSREMLFAWIGEESG